MKTALYSALLLLALALTAAVLVVGYDLHQVLIVLRGDLSDAHQVLTQTSVAAAKLVATADTVNAAAAKLVATADTVNAAATEEKNNWQATSLEAAQTGRALRMLISRVDRSFVDGTLYHVNSETLPAIDAQVTTNGDELRATVHKLGETADGLTASTSTLNTRLGDPAIGELVGHANVAAANLETVSANAARITGDLAKIADDATAPQPWYKRAWGYIWAPIKISAVFLK